MKGKFIWYIFRLLSVNSIKLTQSKRIYYIALHSFIKSADTVLLHLNFGKKKLGIKNSELKKKQANWSRRCWRIRRKRRVEQLRKNLPFTSKMTHDASHALHTPKEKKLKSTNLLESASDLTRKAQNSHHHIGIGTQCTYKYSYNYVHALWKYESYHWTQCVLFYDLLLLFSCVLFISLQAAQIAIQANGFWPRQI